MPVVVRLLLALLAMFGFDGSAANAASVKEVFEQHRLIGTFASDCGKPASRANEYWVFRVLGENVQKDVMTGPTTRASAGIVDRTSVAGLSQIAQSYLSGNNNRWNEVVRVEPGRMRTWESQIEDRPKIISGGRFTDDRAETSWFNKCT